MAAPVNAVKILRSKLAFLIKVVKESPEVRKNQDFMRRLNQIVNSTPIVTSKEFDSQQFNEYADATTINILTSVTQSLEQIQNLIEDFNVINTSSKSGRGGMGDMQR